MGEPSFSLLMEFTLQKRPDHSGYARSYFYSFGIDPLGRINDITLTLSLALMNEIST